MGYDVQIEIDRGKTGGTFTNHDIISGVVKLTTTSSLTLSYIQVKLEGVSETQLVIPGRSAREIERDENRNHRKKDRRKDKRDKKDKFRQDTHKVLYDSSIVFPPENVRQVSQAKDFTLTPGTYTYAFSFKIPLNTSCKKLSGITNKISFSKNSFDLVVNNGNFNTKYLVNSASNFMMNINGSGQTTNIDGQNHLTKAYHIDSQLPPSLPDMNGMASIKYFVKVTCKRSSILKANLRAFDPFVFLPLDIDRRYEPLRTGEQFMEYRERYFRKEVIFKDRLSSANGKPTSVKDLPPTPELKSRGFMSTFFGKSSTQHSPATSIYAVDVPFAFELRMPHPPSLSPTAVPSFKLFFVSSVDPARYTLANRGKPDQSNGLGIMYLQSLKLELKCVTLISVLDNDGGSTEIHQSRIEEDIPLCHNTYQNLQFDLMKCKRQKSSTASSSGFGGHTSYELEIPSRFYENCRFPRNLPPTFHTCNIARGYGLSVQVGISSEQLLETSSARERSEKLKYVDVFCPDIHVLSGLKLTSTLHSNASGTSLGKVSEHRSGSLSNGYPADFKPPLSAKNSQHSVPPINGRPDMTPPMNQNVYEEDHKSDAPLPTYNDVVRESSYQDDSEHQRARYRYGG